MRIPEPPTFILDQKYDSTHMSANFSRIYDWMSKLCECFDKIPEGGAFDRSEYERGYRDGVTFVELLIGEKVKNMAKMGGGGAGNNETGGGHSKPYSHENDYRDRTDISKP